MKKLILIILSICMISISVDAQNEKFSIGISGGAGIPVGAWGKKSPDDSKFIGFANPGWAYDLSFSYQLGKGNFGLTTLLRRQTNIFDTDALANIYREENPTSTYTVESDDWRMNQFLLGGFGNKSITEKLDIEMKALLGVVGVNLPLWTLYGDEVNFITQGSDTAISFAYLVGAGVKYQLGNKLDFLVNVDYLGAKPKFDSEVSSNVGSGGNTIFSQQMMSVNLSVGLAMKF